MSTEATYEPTSSTISDTERPKRATNDVVTRIARYQSGIKMAVAALATVIACLLIEMHVEFVYTLPLMFLVPWAMRMWCRKSWPILVAGFICAYPLAYLGDKTTVWNIGMLAIYAAVSVAAGTIGGALSVWVWKQSGVKRVAGALVLGIALIAGCWGSFVAVGSPAEYIRTLSAVNTYKERQYAGRPEVDFRFKSVKLRRLWDENQSPWPNYVEYEAMTMNYELNETILGGYGGGYVQMFVRDNYLLVDDDYDFYLSQQFDQEQSERISPYVIAATGFDPNVVVSVSSDNERGPSLREEFLNNYTQSHKLSPKMEQARQKAMEGERIDVEWNVPSYEWKEFPSPYGGTAMDMFEYLTKDEFMERAVAIYQTLDTYGVKYSGMNIMAGLKGKEAEHISQSISINGDFSLEQMIASYDTSEY